MLGKALGEGTFGKVKLGTHILTGEKVSFEKILLPSNIKQGSLKFINIFFPFMIGNL